jgi:hypothetical protein
VIVERLFGQYAQQPPGLVQPSGLSVAGNGHRFTSNGDIASRVVNPPDTAMMAQKTKKAAV